MAKNSSLAEFASPEPCRKNADAHGNLTEPPSREYDDLIDTLPLKTFCSQEIRLYRGFWFEDPNLRGALTFENHFQSRPNDIFVTSYPKSGTTWLKALVFAMMTRTRYPLDQHALLMNNPHKCVPTIEIEIASGRSSLIESLPSPRILSTHLPYSLLPHSITESDGRIIYICRDPKDVLVSQHHFMYEFFSMGDRKVPFDDTFAMFCDGTSPCGPIWDHVSEYSKESVANPEKILFLKYEDMLQETVKHVKMIAEFIGHPFSEVEEKNGMVEQIVALCSFKKLKDLDVNKTTVSGILEKPISTSALFRKGVVGDWRNHMTPEMAKKMDSITKK